MDGSGILAGRGPVPVRGPVLVVRGLDDAARSGLHHDVRRLTDAGARVVTLDLSALERIDTHALRAVVAAARVLRRHDGRLRLTGLHPAVASLLARAGLGRAFLWPAVEHSPAYAAVSAPAA